MSRLRIGNGELPTADSRHPTSLSQQFLIGFPQFIFATLLLTALNLAAQNPFISHYTISDGLPSDNITHIFQDREKFIWITTGDGLARALIVFFLYIRIHLAGFGWPVAMET
jgi:hypothetical protein